MIKKILLSIVAVVVIVIAAVLILASQKPSTFRYERSMVLTAPPATVFPMVNDLHKWPLWSPWAEEDPTSTGTYAGPEAGVGSSFAWVGPKSGEGTMTVTESKPNELVRMKLEFRKPFEATNTVDLTFVPEGTGTRMTWTMYGPQEFLGKVMSVFMDCEKMCGDMFIQGMTKLNAVTQQQPPAANQ